jgi:myo-inositol-1(or 4)-monophosphatase
VPVDHGKEALVLLLQRDPGADGAEVVADMEFARGLNAGEDARHRLTTYAAGGRRRKVRELKDLVDVARRAADRAARYLRDTAPATSGTWLEKAPHDFVTAADREAERLITDALTREVPGSTVVGEELSPAAARAGDVVWIVDPLDGTTNFLHRYQQYAVSIGCIVRGTLQVGVVHDVPRDIVYWGAAGLGAWQGVRRLTVSGETEPSRALVGTGFPFKRLEALPQYLRQFAAVTAAASGIRRAGSAALDLADVAAGRFDAFWEFALAPWDIAAGVVLIREAGGVATTFDGSNDVLGDGSIVAGNPALHRWLGDLVRLA